MHRIQCTCGREMTVNPALAGRFFKCPGCGMRHDLDKPVKPVEPEVVQRVEPEMIPTPPLLPEPPATMDDDDYEIVHPDPVLDEEPEVVEASTRAEPCPNCSGDTLQREVVCVRCGEVLPRSAEPVKKKCLTAFPPPWPKGKAPDRFKPCPWPTLDPKELRRGPWWYGADDWASLSYRLISLPLFTAIMLVIVAMPLVFVLEATGHSGLGSVAMLAPYLWMFIASISGTFGLIAAVAGLVTDLDKARALRALFLSLAVLLTIMGLLPPLAMLR